MNLFSRRKRNVCPLDDLLLSETSISASCDRVWSPTYPVHSPQTIYVPFAVHLERELLFCPQTSRDPSEQQLWVARTCCCHLLSTKGKEGPRLFPRTHQEEKRREDRPPLAPPIESAIVPHRWERIVVKYFRSYRGYASEARHYNHLVRLQCPHICPLLFSHYPAVGMTYYPFDLFTFWCEVMTPRGKMVSPLLFLNISFVGRTILEFLCFLEKNELQHQDIKPENIVVRHENDRIVEMKVIDMEFLSTARVGGKQQGLKGGTLDYVAPEFLPYLPGGKKGLVDHPYPQGMVSDITKGDMYSFGKTILFLIVHPSTSMVALRHLVHHDTMWKDIRMCVPYCRPILLLQTLIGPCLEKDPSRRPTAHSLLERWREHTTEIERILLETTIQTVRKDDAVSA